MEAGPPGWPCGHNPSLSLGSGLEAGHARAHTSQKVVAGPIQTHKLQAHVRAPPGCWEWQQHIGTELIEGALLGAEGQEERRELLRAPCRACRASRALWASPASCSCCSCSCSASCWASNRLLSSESRSALQRCIRQWRVTLVILPTGDEGQPGPIC